MEAIFAGLDGRETFRTFGLEETEKVVTIAVFGITHDEKG